MINCKIAEMNQVVFHRLTSIAKFAKSSSDEPMSVLRMRTELKLDD